MLRCVDEVAKELNVSKTAIYNKLKLKGFSCKIIKKQGKSMIDENLFNLIKDSIKVKNQVEFEIENKESIRKNERRSKQELVMDREDSFNLNKSLINTLISQLEEKDKQIAELHKLIENNQVLLKKKQENNVNILALEEHFKEVDIKLNSLKNKMNQSKESKGFLERIFKK